MEYGTPRVFNVLNRVFASRGAGMSALVNVSSCTLCDNDAKPSTASLNFWA